MPKNIRRHNFRILSYVALGLIASFVLAIGLTIRGLWTDAIQEANTNIGNIATVLSEQLARSIQSVDIVLTDVREQVEKQAPSAEEEFDQQIRGHDLYEFLTERLGRLSQADFIAVIDRTGHIANTTRHWVTANVDVVDRDYFQHLKQENDDGIHISDVLTNRVTGAPTIFVSKRINSARDEFRGVFWSD